MYGKSIVQKNYTYLLALLLYNKRLFQGRKLY